MSIRELFKEIRASAAWDGIKLLWSAGGAAVATVVHAVVGFFTGHPNLVALLITAATAAILAIVALIIYNNPRPGKHQSASLDPALPSPETTETGRLKIISARYGIGGEAYKPVTEQLCKIAKPDSLHFSGGPQSYNALFWPDPYPNLRKHLKAVYSFTSEATFDEDTEIILPILDVPKEHSPKVDALPSPQMSQGEYKMSNNARGVFENLPPAQKVLVKRIYESPGLQVAPLIAGLEAQGFADPGAVLNAVLQTELVEKNFTGNVNPALRKNL
jgi:hypothetical protein